MIGIAAMLVVALFFITNLSKDLSAPVTPVPANEEATFTERPAGAEEEPDADRPSIFERLAADESALPGGIGSVVDSLDAVIDASEGEAAQQARRQKIDMLIGAGRMDHAAVTQRAVAREEGSPEAWRRAGDLFYEWMGRMNEGPERVEVAEAAIAAYDRVLAQTPDNLDVRADLATALLETNEPMRGVEEIQRVLDADPDHLQARFNYGIMLAMIGRAEAAIAQFEHAQRIVGEGSPFYRQAEQIIAELRQSEGQPMPGGERLQGEDID
jgi:tetratricopeptide (TPR) repeat protein